MKLKSRKPQPLLKPRSAQKAIELPEDSGPHVLVPSALDEGVKWMQEAFTHCSDLVCRQFTIGLTSERKAALFYIDGLIDKDIVNDHVLTPLLIDTGVQSRRRWRRMIRGWRNICWRQAK